MTIASDKPEVAGGFPKRSFGGGREEGGSRPVEGFSERGGAEAEAVEKERPGEDQTTKDGAAVLPVGLERRRVDPPTRGRERKWEMP